MYIYNLYNLSCNTDLIPFKSLQGHSCESSIHQKVRISSCNMGIRLINDYVIMIISRYIPLYLSYISYIFIILYIDHIWLVVYLPL